VATGYYIAIPDTQVGRSWRPDLEAAAAGIGAAIYGPDDAIVMGISAARLHGAIPRALATAVIAVPSRHDPIAFADRAATVRFTVRDTSRLDATRMPTELCTALVSTIEQTVLDLTKRPTLGNAAPEAVAAVDALFPRCDPDILADIAEAQNMRATLARLRTQMRERA
jgi:hypothetical protein